MYIKILIALLVLSSCQNRNRVRHLIWKSGEDVQVLHEISQAEQQKSSEIIFQHKTIQHFKQSYEGNVVETTAVKKIYDHNNKVSFAEAHIFAQQSLNKLKKIQLTNKNELEIAAHILKLYPEAKIQTIKSVVAIFHTDSDLEQVYKSQFEIADGRFVQVVFDRNFKLLKNTTLGSQLSAIDSSVYLLGPKFGVLQDVTLQIVKSPVLAGYDIFVDSQADNKITTIGQHLKFDPKDERFEQVQVFYYLSKLRQWVNDKLEIQFVNRIDVEVNVGYPKKTNTAFYFQNKIRLGRGDDIDYSNMSLDPTVVSHEGFHAVIDGLANLPFEGQGGSLNEGYADFYTAVMIGRPFLAETSYLKASYKRTVSNDLKLSDMTGGLYHDSGIISGLLWALREAIGDDNSTLKVATAALSNLNHFSQFSDFNEALLEQIKSTLPDDKKRLALIVLKDRGFKYE